MSIIHQNLVDTYYNSRGKILIKHILETTSSTICCRYTLKKCTAWFKTLRFRLKFFTVERSTCYFQTLDMGDLLSDEKQLLHQHQLDMALHLGYKWTSYNLYTLTRRKPIPNALRICAAFGLTTYCVLRIIRLRGTTSTTRWTRPNSGCVRNWTCRG